MVEVLNTIQEMIRLDIIILGISEMVKFSKHQTTEHKVFLR